MTPMVRVPTEQCTWTPARMARDRCRGPFCSLHLFVCFIFQDRDSLCTPGCPQTQSEYQAGPELTDLPA